MIKEILIDSSTNQSFWDADLSDSSGRHVTPNHYRMRELYTFFSCIWHPISCMTFSRHGDHDHQRKCRILIHHWRWTDSIDQLTNFDDHTERFRFCLNVTSGLEIGILLSYPSWSSLRSVVDRETTTSALFQALKILLLWANRLEIRIYMSWRSSLAIVLGLEPKLDSFEQVRLVIFKMTGRAFDLDNNLVLSLGSFPHGMNDGFLCLRYILNFCYIYCAIICLITKISLFLS